MSTFNVITNLTNGAGLQRDYLLIKAMLESYGHKVDAEMFNATYPTFRQHDVNIFLEVVNPDHMRYATQNWVVPNSEWWFQCWDSTLPRMTKVLTKTLDAQRIWQAKVGNKAQYIGWDANDFYQPQVTREPAFLHMSRNSENKGTEFIIQAWRDLKLPYPLTIVGRKEEICQMLRQPIPNVTHIKELPEADVPAIMNRHLFHLAPTRYEGFGMWIHEAIGCGGIVLTTDAPPMNEFNGIARELLIPVQRRVPRLIASFNFVSPVAVAEAVHKAAALPDERRAELQTAARAAYLADKQAFRKAFAEVARGNF